MNQFGTSQLQALEEVLALKRRLQAVDQAARETKAALEAELAAAREDAAGVAERYTRLGSILSDYFKQTAMEDQRHAEVCMQTGADLQAKVAGLL